MLEIEQPTKIVTMQFKTEAPKDRLKDHLSEDELTGLKTEYDAVETDCKSGEQILHDTVAQYQELADKTRTSKLLTVRNGKATVEIVSSGNRTPNHDYGPYSISKLEKPGDIYFSHALRPDYEEKTAFVSTLVACVKASS